MAAAYRPSRLQDKEAEQEQVWGFTLEKNGDGVCKKDAQATPHQS
jgi:hypothetical protein